MSSDQNFSKVSDVVKDLREAGVNFKMNPFTANLLKMLTADSVNILKNVKLVDIKSDESKTK